MESGNHHRDEILDLIGYRRSWPKTIVIWILIALSGFTLFLFFYWRKDILVALTHKKVDMFQAEVFVIQSASLEKIRLFEYVENLNLCESIPFCFEEGRNSVRFFTHHNIKYIWNRDQSSFIPISGLDQQCNLDTISTKPLTQDQVSRLLAFFGPNRVHVPLTPIFVKLFHEIPPQNERRLRDKVQMAESAMVLRQNYDEPRVVPSTSLVPGDIVCIPPQGCEMVADVLLISGSCAVNEASLTGESIPQAKAPITEIPTPVTDEDRKIDIRRLARHVLFSGTRVLQAKPSHMEPHVKAVVLRTGFLTVKGDLVRAILYPRPLDIDFTLDSFRFLSIMAVIAIAGSVYTWIILFHDAPPGLQQMLIYDSSAY
ncbi:hypothetical protein ACTXT7_008237 [Hymenolepis weldensis]